MRLYVKRKVAEDRCFSSSHIQGGASVFDYSVHCRGIVRLGRYLARREHRPLEEVVRPHSVRRDLPGVYQYKSLEIEGYNEVAELTKINGV